MFENESSRSANNNAQTINLKNMKNIVLKIRYISLVLVLTVLAMNSCQEEESSAVQSNQTIPLSEKLENDQDFLNYMNASAELMKPSAIVLKSLNEHEAELFMKELNSLLNGERTEKNSDLIIAKLGFSSKQDFFQLTQKFYKQGEMLNKKYPALAGMSVSDKTALFSTLVKTPTIENSLQKKFGIDNASRVNGPCWTCDVVYWACTIGASAGYVVAAAACTAVAPPLIAWCIGGAWVGAASGIVVCAVNLSNCRATCN
jgi:hypothetical protein